MIFKLTTFQLLPHFIFFDFSCYLCFLAFLSTFLWQPHLCIVLSTGSDKVKYGTYFLVHIYFLWKRSVVFKSTLYSSSMCLSSSQKHSVCASPNFDIFKHLNKMHFSRKSDLLLYELHIRAHTILSQKPYIFIMHLCHLKSEKYPKRSREGKNIVFKT